MSLPRIDIDIGKIAHNTRVLREFYGAKGIKIIGVTKLIGGNPILADILVKNGIEILADSRIENILKMQKYGVKASYLLLRTPALSQVEEVVAHVDMSLNTELTVLSELSKCALRNNVQHKVILMVELGDLREGIMPSEMDHTVIEVLLLKGLTLMGIGTNLACLGGVNPDISKMDELSSITTHLEDKFGITLSIISGGNSANYNWFRSSKEIGRINNLRIGESIFLGREALNRKPIPELFTDVFTLVSEVVESKLKPSLPFGERSQDMNGEILEVEDSGLIQRTILGIGIQDILVSGLTPKQNVTVLGATSDHIVVNSSKTELKVGDTVAFSLNYAALLGALNSSYITRRMINIYESTNILQSG